MYCGLPTYDNRCLAETSIAWTLGAMSDAAEVVWGKSKSPFLPHSFNELWANALNKRAEGVTHFAMLHADVVPDAGWLERLLHLLTIHEADVVSAVVPLKDETGRTSTLLEGADGSREFLTLRDVWTGPSTFTAADLDEPDKTLLLNTGCWACKLGDWCEGVWFRAHTFINRTDAGLFEALTYPEDWDFSRQLARLGRKAMATRLVPLYHERPEWHNRGPWGTL